MTSELHPFTAGGIGRLLYNLLRDSLQREAPVELHLLFPSWSPLEVDEVAAHFGRRVRVHRAARGEAAAHGSGELLQGRGRTPAETDSLELMLALRDLERQVGAFDVVEFPDFLGWAYSTLRERELGRGFATTEVAVRLHGADGLIAHLERRPQPAAFELERRALVHADVIVTHLASVAEANQRFYGLGAAWRRRVVVQFPPVAEPTQQAPAAPAPPDLLFITKVQVIKRPDLFVRGAAAFMAQTPDFSGRAILCCHVPDQRYADSIRALIPAALRHRFLFAPSAERGRLLTQGSVAVIPSDFESLNLAAYEAAALGARLVLNGRCPAFGEGTPFLDGHNCYKFDGSAGALAVALGRAVAAPPAHPVVWRADAPYYEAPRPRPERSHLRADLLEPLPAAKQPLRYAIADRLAQLVRRAPAHRHLLRGVRFFTATERPLRYELADRLSGLVGRPVRGLRRWWT